MKLFARAPGKVNLCLFLGPVRSDGRHELVTLFESVSLADSIEVTVARIGDAASAPADSPAAQVAWEPAHPPADQVVCPGVNRLNIVAQTLDGLRARGWDAPPVRVLIDKRIPVAGGMGGGSADAAAVLRLAARLAPIPEEAVAELAVALGADVPSQLVPGVSIGTGAGEIVSRVDPLGPHAFVVVPQPFALATAAVYREADRLRLSLDPADLQARERELRVALHPGADLPADLLVNDLEPAAVSLRPAIGRALDVVREAGAWHAMVSGSGPTVLGLFHGPDAPARAADAADGLVDRYPGATSATPVSEEFGAPRGT